MPCTRIAEPSRARAVDCHGYVAAHTRELHGKLMVVGAGRGSVRQGQGQWWGVMRCDERVKCEELFAFIYSQHCK
jgi:hypothetical protein